MKNPCYRCEKRVSGCHASCVDYGAFAESRKEARRKAFVDREVTGFVIDGTIRGRDRKERLRRK